MVKRLAIVTVSSVWIESPKTVLACERNVWSKFSAGRKFVRCRVNVALNSRVYFLQAYLPSMAYICVYISSPDL